MRGFVEKASWQLRPYESRVPKDSRQLYGMNISARTNLRLTGTGDRREQGNTQNTLIALSRPPPACS